MNPLKRFTQRIGKLLRRAKDVAENLLLTLLGRERPNRPRFLKPDEELPPDAEYRKTFLVQEDAEEYAKEIPVPTIIVIIEADESALLDPSQDDPEPKAYDVYVVY